MESHSFSSSTLLSIVWSFWSLKIEDEYHFLIDCPIYNSSRKICYQKISELCSNFNNMSDKSKFYYLFTNEDLSIINIFGKCIIECLETRKLKQGLWYWNIFFLFLFILLINFFKALNPTRNIVFIFFFFLKYMYNCLQWHLFAPIVGPLIGIIHILILILSLIPDTLTLCYILIYVHKI